MAYHGDIICRDSLLRLSCLHGNTSRGHTRFVPHWFMMTAIVILGSVFLY